MRIREKIRFFFKRLKYRFIKNDKCEEMLRKAIKILDGDTDIKYELNAVVFENVYWQTQKTITIHVDELRTYKTEILLDGNYNKAMEHFLTLILAEGIKASGERAKELRKIHPEIFR
jgi:hypothetical protein